MTWINVKLYNAIKNHFAEMLDDNDFEIIKDVLGMQIHRDHGGEYVSNILSDCRERGMSSSALKTIVEFNENWGKSVNQ
jgi:transposase-like protein